MSAQDNGFKTQIVIVFAAPSGINTDVIGTDEDSGDTSFVFKALNSIDDITNLDDPIETHSVFTLRLNLNRTRLGTTKQYLTSFSGDKRPIFPKFIGSGQVKFVSQQGIMGAGLEAHTIIITTRTPLAT